MKEDLSDKGTALFIAATLLQREAVETLVPMQAAAILSLFQDIKDFLRMHLESSQDEVS